MADNQCFRSVIQEHIASWKHSINRFIATAKRCAAECVASSSGKRAPFNEQRLPYDQLERRHVARAAHRLAGQQGLGQVTGFQSRTHGLHAKYRALKVLLLWYEAEYEPENWKNPVKKVKPPKVPENEIKPVETEDLLKLLMTCDGGTFADIRDKAIMLFLFDTGVRVQECVDVLLVDCDLWSGEVFIGRGKGGKSRTVYMGKISLRFVRKFMKLRTDKTPTLWVTSVGHPLAKKSVQGMLERRAEEAGIPVQSAHRFPKAFSTIMAEAASISSLMSLTGDSMEVLQKHYVRRDVSTAMAAHERGSPVDKLLP